MKDPEQLIAELVRAGWTVKGVGRGHQRLGWPGSHDRSFLMVPTEPSAPEFTDMWNAALSELESAVDVGAKAAHVLGGVVAAGNRAQGRLGRLRER